MWLAAEQDLQLCKSISHTCSATSHSNHETFDVEEVGGREICFIGDVRHDAGVRVVIRVQCLLDEGKKNDQSMKVLGQMDLRKQGKQGGDARRSG